MNVLLTTSHAPLRSPFSTSEKRFPIGVGYLIGSLERAGHRVFWIDNYLSPTRFWETDYLERQQIDFVGIYSNTICARGTHDIIEGCDRRRQSGKWRGQIMVGGPHPRVMVHPLPAAADYVVKGEGELTIVDIVEGRLPPGVHEGRKVEDLDSLPRPAYHHFASLPYETWVDAFRDAPVFTMNTSRGCPYPCTFCTVNAFWGLTYRHFSPARMVDDIEFLRRDYGVRGIYFREDIFTLFKDRVTAFCELLLQKDIRIKWLCETRVHPLSRELLALMARAGCRWIYFGCESGSPAVLKRFQKQITVDHIRQALGWCRELGIRAYTSWVIGSPFETEDDLQMTLRLIQETKPYSFGLNVYVGLPGGELYRETLDSGEYCFIDDLGLVYGKRHDELVRRFYGSAAKSFLVPTEPLDESLVHDQVRVAEYGSTPFAKRMVGVLQGSGLAEPVRRLKRAYKRLMLTHR